MSTSRPIFCRTLTLAALSIPVLLCGCAPMVVAHMPDVSTITVKNDHAHPTDCSSLQQPSELDLKDGPIGVTPRPSVAFGCATYNDLAQMVANPRDLVAPRPYAGQSGGNAGEAVQRYYDDKVKALLDNANTSSVASTGSSSSSSGNSSSGTSSSGSGSTP